MKKILFVLLLISSISQAQVYQNGKQIARFEDSETVKDGHGYILGRITARYVYDNKGYQIGRISDSKYIYDKSGNQIARFVAPELYDQNGYVIGKVIGNEFYKNGSSIYKFYAVDQTTFILYLIFFK